MKPLGYQEMSWHISLAPSTDMLTIAAFDNERDVLTAADRPQSASGMPISLTSLIRGSDQTTPRWVRRRVPTEDAVRIGVEVWNAVPLPLRSALPLGGQVRLKVSSEVPAAADVPWEWLSDGSGPPFALRPEFSIVRSVPIRFPVHPLSVELPLRVLVLAPNPRDERLLDANRELQALLSALEASEYTVSVLDLPYVAQLRDVMAAQQPNVVHYVGHGGLTHGEGNLILLDPDGRSRWLSATELGSLLPSSVRLLCLATPFTTDNYQLLGLPHLARASSSAGLPTTVVNQYPVSEKAVRVFWGTFYRALIDMGGNVTDAVQAARAEVSRNDAQFSDWGSFSLTVRDQTGVSFEFRSQADADSRRDLEFQAQFAAEAANDLAAQIEVLGDATPTSIRHQYEVQEKHVTRLLDDLAE